MFNICELLVHYSRPLFILVLPLAWQCVNIIIDRATEANSAANIAVAKTKLTLPVLAIGSEAFIGKEVKNQMEKVAERVQYQELKFGHPLCGGVS
jgi:hypothetical protein